VVPLIFNINLTIIATRSSAIVQELPKILVLKKFLLLFNIWSQLLSHTATPYNSTMDDPHQSAAAEARRANLEEVLAAFADIGSPLNPSMLQKLNEIPFWDHINTPRYQTSELRTLVLVTGYHTFLDHLKEKNGGPVPRKYAEAAWAQLLLRKYAKYDPREMAAADGEDPLKWKQNLLMKGMSQVSHSASPRYSI